MTMPNAVFDRKKVIGWNKRREFDRIPHIMLMDFLPSIMDYELPILEKWRKYFISIGTPFAITRDKYHFKRNGKKCTEDLYILWKERRV